MTANFRDDFIDRFHQDINGSTPATSPATPWARAYTSKMRPT